jgi:hypothetical protein
MRAYLSEDCDLLLMGRTSAEPEPPVNMHTWINVKHAYMNICPVCICIYSCVSTWVCTMCMYVWCIHTYDLSDMNLCMHACNTCNTCMHVRMYVCIRIRMRWLHHMPPYAHLWAHTYTRFSAGASTLWRRRYTNTVQESPRSRSVCRASLEWWSVISNFTLVAPPERSGQWKGGTTWPFRRQWQACLHSLGPIRCSGVGIVPWTCANKVARHTSMMIDFWHLWDTAIIHPRLDMAPACKAPLLLQLERIECTATH